MSLLVTILLSYAKVTSAAPRFTRVALDDVCLAAMQNLEPAIAESGATIQVEALPEVDGDPALLSQVLQNLIANALKYRSPQPPVVRIAAARRGGQWVISVEDNGIGIAPDDQGRLFKVFGRLHAFADIPGAGIGLASCRRIVELHGGLIWIDSVPGKGSTFSFTIPVAR